MKVRLLFHYVSYLQYPLMLAGAYFMIQPYINGFGSVFEDLNNALIFIGIAISFSTLQDTTKTQNKLSKRVWESRKKGNIFLGVLAGSIVFFMSLGLLGFLSSQDSNLKELSIGLIVLGIGLMGLLKAAVEMAENHRLE